MKTRSGRKYIGKRKSYRRKFKRFKKARRFRTAKKFTRKVQRALRRTEEQKFVEVIAQQEILAQARDFNQLLILSSQPSPNYTTAQGLSATQRVGNKITISKVTYKFSITPQIANEYNPAAAPPANLANYFINANTHELVRVYFMRPRSGNNIDIALTMAVLIGQGFPDSMDDMPSMNFLRMWKILKVKNKTMNSIYPTLIATAANPQTITGFQVFQTGKPRKLNFKYKIKGPFQLSYNGANQQPIEVPYKKQLIAVVQTSIGSAMDFQRINNNYSVCYDVNTKFRTLYTDN